MAKGQCHVIDKNGRFYPFTENRDRIWAYRSFCDDFVTDAGFINDAQLPKVVPILVCIEKSWIVVRETYATTG